MISHCRTLCESVVEARLKRKVKVSEQWYGFFYARKQHCRCNVCSEGVREGLKELECVFVDVGKAYDRMPRKELWYCLRKSEVAEFM